MRSRDAELWYGTETSWASSGAPVFNDSWQVVAIHRAGAPARDRAGRVLTVDGAPWIDGHDEARVVWRAGVGARAAAIVHCLATRCGDHPLIEEVLAHADADASVAIVLPLGSGAEPAMPPKSPAEEHSRLSESADGAESNGAHPAEATAPGPAVTVTVPLRITVRTGNGSGREPAVGVNLS
jgi:endonuclease G